MLRSVVIASALALAPAFSAPEVCTSSLWCQEGCKNEWTDRPACATDYICDGNTLCDGNLIAQGGNGCRGDQGFADACGTSTDSSVLSNLAAGECTPSGSSQPLWYDPDPVLNLDCCSAMNAAQNSWWKCAGDENLFDDNARA